MKTTEKQKESLKKYYLKNKEKLNKLAKENYINNKEQKLKVRKEYVEKKQLTELVTFEIAESSTHDTRKKFEKVLTLIKNSGHTI